MPASGARPGAAALALEQAFDADTLADLRKAVLENAARAGMPAQRAVDVMLAVHELAANAVRYGGGAGVAALRADPGALHCRVTDPGPGGADSLADSAAGGGSEPAWPLIPGHGLWLVHQIAEQVSVTSGPGGSQVSAVFALR